MQNYLKSNLFTIIVYSTPHSLYSNKLHKKRSASSSLQTIKAHYESAFYWFTSFKSLFQIKSLDIQQLKTIIWHHIVQNISNALRKNAYKTWKNILEKSDP